MRASTKHQDYTDSPKQHNTQNTNSDATTTSTHWHTEPTIISISRVYYYVARWCPLIPSSHDTYPILSYPTLSYPIRFYPILSDPILSYPIRFYPILSDPILSYPILSYPILSPILSYPILSDPILSYPILFCPILSYIYYHIYTILK